jgi:hypothetical protein
MARWPKSHSELFFLVFYKKNNNKKIRANMKSFRYNWSNYKNLELWGVDCKN